MLQLEILWNLQNVDSMTRSVKKDVESKRLYERLCVIKEEYNSIKAVFKEQSMRYEKDNKAIVRLNMDLKHLDQKVKENSQRQYEDGNSLRIIENLQRETEICKKKIDETENMLLQLMEANEKINKQIEAAKGTMTDLKAEFEKLKKQYSERCERAKEELRMLISRREALIKELDSGLIKQYDYMAKEKVKPLSQVVNGICMECGFKLNAVLYDTVKNKRSEICFCDHCGRILYIEG